MALMHIDPRHPAGPRIQVFIGAPGRKISAPLVELELHIAHPVGQIKAHHRPHGVARLHDGLHVQDLPRIIIDPADHHRRQLLAGLLDGRQDILVPKQHLALAGLHLDDRLLRVEAVVLRLALDGVLIGGKGPALHHDLKALFGGPIKGRHQQVQIRRQRIHGHHFTGLGPHDGRQHGLQLLVKLHPGVGLLKVALDGHLSPGLELSLQGLFHPLWLQPQRIATQIDLGIALLLARDIKALSKPPQGVVGVQLAGVLPIGDLHRRTSSARGLCVSQGVWPLGKTPLPQAHYSWNRIASAGAFWAAR